MGPAQADIGYRVSNGGFFLVKYRMEPIPFLCSNRHIVDVETGRLLLTFCIQPQL